jgi:hypothetical protein
MKPRLTPDTLDPTYRLFLLQLSSDTQVDICELADWIRANLNDLRERFNECDEPTDTDCRVENCQGIWLRVQFKARRVTA